MNDEEADELLETLRDNTEKMSGTEHDFIQSMLENRDNGHHVSDKQLVWLQDIFDRVMSWLR